MSNCLFDISKNYYRILGVATHADEGAIKLAYRRLARKFHPDVSDDVNAHVKFQEISEAYQILTKHRDAYNRALSRFQAQAFRQQTTSKQESSSPYGSHTKSSDFHRESSFRQNTRQDQNYYHHSSRPINGRDRRVVYPMTLKYAIKQLQAGYFHLTTLGVKMKFTRQALEGKTFRISGKGYSGLYGGQPGDFFVTFKITSLYPFELNKNDLIITYPVSEFILSRGGKINIDTPSGFLKVNIPQAFNTDNLLKFSGKGLPIDSMRSLAGDLYIRLEKRRLSA